MFHVSEQQPIITENDGLLLESSSSTNIKSIGKSPAKPKGPRPGITCIASKNEVTITLNSGKKIVVRNMMSKPAPTSIGMLKRDKKRKFLLKAGKVRVDKTVKNNTVPKKQQG